jgi:hypothetical protein
MTVGSMLLAVPAMAVVAQDVNSVTFAQFTQQSSVKVAEYVNTGSGNTLNIVNSPANFVVTSYGPNGVYQSIANLQASSSALITSLGDQFEQTGWNGAFQFTNGGNQLTVNFTDATFSFDATGGSASLISTDPSSPIFYTSDLLDLPAFTFRNFSIAFTGLTPAFSIAANGYGSNFNANVAGSFAGSTGSAVPEPAMWAMMLAGFGFTGAAMRRRRPAMIAVTN